MPELTAERLGEIRHALSLVREYKVIHPGKAAEVIEELLGHIDALTAERARMREALATYAGKTNWARNGMFLGPEKKAGGYLIDYGGLARDALASNPTGTEKLCDDCPPVGYPTDKTRCVKCPRRDPTGAEQT